MVSEIRLADFVADMLRVDIPICSVSTYFSGLNITSCFSGSSMHALILATSIVYISIGCAALRWCGSCNIYFWDGCLTSSSNMLIRSLKERGSSTVSSNSGWRSTNSVSCSSRLAWSLHTFSSLSSKDAQSIFSAFFESLIYLASFARSVMSLTLTSFIYSVNSILSLFSFDKAAATDSSDFLARDSASIARFWFSSSELSKLSIWP